MKPTFNAQVIQAFEADIINARTPQEWSEALGKLKDNYVSYLIADPNFMGNDEDSDHIFALTQLCDFFKEIAD